ncbi:MAG: hypothetical protein A2007_00350 [Verrucomicrobia bacterium GWC2_42_7]|nr:MAG: hypothetical protein A2007_00350 [Verrucomicrobia bacterium GWC2_42_7]
MIFISKKKDQRPLSSASILFFGYSEVGYACLEYLLGRGANIVGVFTHIDNPNENHWFRSVPDLALSRNLKTFTPDSLKETSIQETIRDLKPDIILSCYYRNMVPLQILEIPRLGAFNMHGSLLPKYRGRAPINWAILNGEKETGATLHVMVAKADAGDIIDQKSFPIEKTDTALLVTKKMCDAAVAILDRSLLNLIEGKAIRIKQNDAEATYYSGRKPEDGRIDWQWPADRIYNLIRAVTKPFPGAFADFENGRLLVWGATPPSSVPSLVPTQCDEKPVPGTILSENPLLIQTGTGCLEITDFEWISP